MNTSTRLSKSNAKNISFASKNKHQKDINKTQKKKVNNISKVGFDMHKVSIVPNATPPVQPKLKINTPDDRYEQEADRVADQVVNMTDAHVQRQSLSNDISSISKGIQKKCAKCEEEERIQTKTNGESPAMASTLLTQQIQAEKGKGYQMDAQTQSFMSSRFGTDFSQVRIHHNARAAEMNRKINARAFTVGNDIFFNTNEFKPDVASGKRLLAHELTHVIQQGNGNQFIQRETGPFSFPSECGDVVLDTQEYSRGNNDRGECQYETARITVGLRVNSCCPDDSSMPLTVTYSAVLGGKSYTGRRIPNPSGSGTIRQQEGQASAIASGVVTPGRSGRAGRGMTLSEEGLPQGTTNVSSPLGLTVDDSTPGGIPGDPGDTLYQELPVGTISCIGSSKSGSVNVGGYQRITYSVSADSTGSQGASVTLDEFMLPRGRVSTPLRNITTGQSAYPTFPGTPRDSRCACDPVTGQHTGNRCPLTGAGAGVGD